MTKQEQIRAAIIAAQAERESLARPPGSKPRAKPRANWAASPPGRTPRRFARRPPEK